MTEVEIARVLYERIRRDSKYGLAPYRTVIFIAEMLKRDPMTVLYAIDPERVAQDDKEFVEHGKAAEQETSKG